MASALFDLGPKEALEKVQPDAIHIPTDNFSGRNL